MRNISIALTLSLLFSLLPSAPAAFAQEAEGFSDLPEDHFAYSAVMYLKEQGIISGYDDGTFKPSNSVNRAEAIKLIIAPLVTPEQMAQATEAASSYDDIGEDAWFKPYVELARVAGIVDGPPEKTSFNGANTVIKVEFLKMVQEAFGANPTGSFSEISLPLSQDVATTDDWYYPYLRYAITSSMVMIGQDGTLMPGKQLTRAETAVLLYRFIMYQQGRRTQALLSETESELQITRSFLEESNLPQAEFSSARALLAARGAHASNPDESIVQGAVKIAEAFRSVVRGYAAGVQNENYEETVRLAGEAWNLAETAKQRDSSLSDIVTQIQAIAKGLADSARAKLAEGEDAS